MSGVAASRQRRLRSVLACPNCRHPVTPLAPIEVAGAIVDADLDCATCGIVGVIRNYRMSFHADDLGDGWLPRGLAERPIGSDQVAVVGEWIDLPYGRLGMGIGACLTGRTSAPGLIVHFGTHQWGGTGAVTLGSTTIDAGLHSRDPGMKRVVLLGEADGAERAWSVLIAPPASVTRGGSQGIVTRISELVPADSAPPLEFSPVNRGNPYPARFDELLAELGPDAIVLDLGGGDRQHPDPRVLNFEYLRYAAPDFYGDGLQLPVADESIDLILSQAVLEHVPDPQRAVDEMRRVLRPNGRIYCDFAFMQPLHAVPHHFFNITPHGAALLFREWNVEQTSTFGGLSVTLSWFFQLLDAERHVGADAVRSVLDTLGELDARLSPDALDYVASAVSVEARRKP